MSMTYRHGNATAHLLLARHLLVPTSALTCFLDTQSLHDYGVDANELGTRIKPLCFTGTLHRSLSSDLKLGKPRVQRCSPAQTDLLHLPLSPPCDDAVARGRAIRDWLSGLQDILF